MGNLTYVPSDKSCVTYLKTSTAADAPTEFTLTRVAQRQIYCDVRSSQQWKHHNYGLVQCEAIL